MKRRKRNAPGPSFPEASLSAGAALGRGLLFLHLLLSPLLFVRDTVEVFEFPKVALLHLTAILLGALGLSAWISRIPQKPPGAFVRESVLEWARSLVREPIPAGFLLFLLSAAVSTATSISPRTSLHGAPESYAGLITILAYTILFFATRGLCRTLEDGRRLLAAPVIGAAAASVYALLQTACLDPIGWEKVSNIGSYVRPAGTMGHPNLLAAFLVMALPLALFFAGQAARRRQWKILAVLAAACGLAALAILASVSRGAWLALLGSLVLVLVGWLRLRWGRPSRPLVWILPLVVAGVVLLSFAGPGGHEILARVIDRARHWNDSPSRLHIWRAGLRLFRASPLFGCGLDAFQLAFSRVRTPAYWHTEWNGTPSRAHNEAIHLLATQGLLGALAVLVLTTGLIRAAVRVWRRSSGADRMLGVAITAGIAGFYLQDLFSFTVAGCGTLFVTFAALLSRLERGDAALPSRPVPPSSPGYAVILAAVLAGLAFLGNVLREPALDGFSAGLSLVSFGAALALVSWSLLRLEFCQEKAALESPRREWARPTHQQPSSFLTRSLQVGIWAGALVLAWWGVLRPVQANLACRAGDRVLEQDPRQALEKFARAVNLDPGQDIYWSRIGEAAQNEAVEVRSPEERRRLLLRAGQALARASQLVPVNPFHHSNFGLLLAILAGEKLAAPSQVYAEFDRALALDENNVYFHLDAARSALALGECARARQYAEAGLKRYPDFGPLRAQLAYIALREKHFQDGLRLLDRALAPDAWWYGDYAGVQAALTTRERLHLVISDQ